MRHVVGRHVAGRHVVRYNIGGVWHVVRFERRAPAVAFFGRCVDLCPRHVNAVAWGTP